MYLRIGSRTRPDRGSFCRGIRASACFAPTLSRDETHSAAGGIKCAAINTLNAVIGPRSSMNRMVLARYCPRSSLLSSLLRAFVEF